MLYSQKGHNLGVSQERQYFSKRPSSMAVLVLLGTRELRVGAVNFRKQKNRVITESVAAARCVSQYARSEIRSNRKNPPLSCNRCNANESGAPLIAEFSFHFSEQFVNSILVRRIRASIARGMDSGRAVERRDYQS